MFTAGARLAWHDRNPSQAAFNYGNTVAPHANTQRWTYTVPAARKCMIEVLMARALRVTVAAPVGRAGGFVYLSNVTNNPALIDVALINNTVGAIDARNLGGSVTLLAGNTIEAWTSDASTGGTVEWAMMMKGLEFDA